MTDTSVPEYTLRNFLDEYNPMKVTRLMYHFRYALWSLGISFVVVTFTMKKWTNMAWAAFGFLAFMLYLILTATPLLQASPYFSPSISPFPSTLGRDGISMEAAQAGYALP